jgi:hypothetical protein
MPKERTSNYLGIWHNNTTTQFITSCPDGILICLCHCLCSALFLQMLLLCFKQYIITHKLPIGEWCEDNLVMALCRFEGLQRPTKNEHKD